MMIRNHVIMVKEFECPKYAKSQSEGGKLPLAGSLKINWLWLKVQTRFASTRPR